MQYVGSSKVYFHCGATLLWSIYIEVHVLRILQVYDGKMTVPYGTKFHIWCSCHNFKQPLHDFSCLHMGGLTNIFSQGMEYFSVED